MRNPALAVIDGVPGVVCVVVVSKIVSRFQKNCICAKPRPWELTAVLRLIRNAISLYVLASIGYTVPTLPRFAANGLPVSSRNTLGSENPAMLGSRTVVAEKIPFANVGFARLGCGESVP